MAKIKKIKKLNKISDDFEKSDKPLRVRRKVNPDELVPTGSTMFNLECSGRIEGAFKLGKIVNLIGDSHAGKTLFGFTVFAECSLLERFDNYRFIYDDVEAANEFDLGYIFNKNVEERIEEGTAGIRSRTIEDFNDNLARAIEHPKPFIYILDSFDALTSEAGIDKDEENRKKREKGQEAKGSYGDGKAKIASEMFSKRTQGLSDDQSVVIIISQTRDNIGFGAMFTPKTRSGGKALKFYSFHEIWLACQKKEKSGKRTLVTNVQAKITKNKLTGRHGEVLFPVLFDYGVDNILSCINFLGSEGDWTGSKTAINTKGFTEDKLSLKKLIQHIEDENREDELFELCQITYDNIFESLKPQRKHRY
jgi:RecA/RadA recombinase